MVTVFLSFCLFFCSFLPFFKKSTVLVNEWNLIIGLFDVVIVSVLKWDHVYFTPFDDSISASRRVPYACDSQLSHFSFY